MTEQTYSSGGTAVAEPPAPLLPASYDEEPENANRQKLMVVGAVVGVLVLLVVVFMLMKGGGSAGDSDSFVPPTHASQPSKDSAADASNPVRLPKSFKGHVGRDPFNALVDPAAAAATTSDSTTSSTTQPTDSTSTTTSTTSTSTDSGTTTAPVTTTTKTPTYKPVWIKLTNVTSKAATFDIGYSNHKSLKVLDFKVKAPDGDTPRIFAKNFALLRIRDGLVAVQFGDGSPFILDMQRNVMIVN